jgi:predicted nicotinamide N-methyase
MLALPYKRFCYKFDGDLVVNGSPILLSSPYDARPSSEAIDGDTGTAVWDAAILLAKFLEENADLVQGKRVLEMGCGLGLCGIACTRLGSQHVTFTDMEYILPTTRMNIFHNHIESVSSVTSLDWFLPKEAKIDWKSVDVVIATDVVWLDNLIDPLINTLRFACECNPNLIVLLSNQRRSNQISESFLSNARATFNVECRLIDGNLEIHQLTVIV